MHEQSTYMQHKGVSQLQHSSAAVSAHYAAQYLFHTDCKLATAAAANATEKHGLMNFCQECTTYICLLSLSVCVSVCFFTMCKSMYLYCSSAATSTAVVDSFYHIVYMQLRVMRCARKSNENTAIE
jgi:hypothetical protein